MLHVFHYPRQVNQSIVVSFLNFLIYAHFHYLCKTAEAMELFKVVNSDQLDVRLIPGKYLGLKQSDLGDLSISSFLCTCFLLILAKLVYSESKKENFLKSICGFVEVHQYCLL